jgi:hypothetical protein
MVTQSSSRIIQGKEARPLTSALLGSAGVVAVALLCVLTVFNFAAGYSEYGRNVRTEFAFTVPVGFYVLVPLAWIGAAYILQTGRWLAVTVILVVLSGIASPPIAWSGPGYMLDAVRPLANLRTGLGTSLVLLSVGIAFLCRPRRARAISKHL